MSPQSRGTVAPEGFSPAAAIPVDALPVFASESYWQGVWRRLQANPRAIVAALFLMLLCVVTLLGPQWWPVDPDQQDPGLISRPHQPAQQWRVVPASHWVAPAAVMGHEAVPASLLPPPQGLQAVSATTEGVRLVWQPVPGAQAYRVYRREEGHGRGAGIPLASLPASVAGYEDRLDLQPLAYRYTVLASDGLEEGPQAASLVVTPESVMPLMQAQLQGLLPADAVLVEGQRVLARVPAHPLGTDYLGRDLLARLLAGARVSLFIGTGAPLLFIAIGMLYGAFAAYAGGRIDEWMMRFADFVIALPFLLFMILLRVAFGIGAGESGVMPLMIAMVVLGWPMTARLVRGQVLQVRERHFVAAARLMGASGPYLVWRHMIPNVMGVVMVSLTFAIPGSIFSEAFLSFIGMGVVPPTPSWGTLCNDGIRSMLTHPHELLYPAVLISLTVLAFNLLGDGLRDALDVNLESRS